MARDQSGSGNKLSAAFVRTVEAPGKYHDGGGLGLYLRVDPSGGRFWVQRVTIDGKRREMGLGGYPIVTLAMARQRALENKRSIYLGVDPIAERRRARRAISFSQAMESYLDQKLLEFRNEKHRKQWRATLDKYAVPILGSRPVADLETSDVLAVLKPIWNEKTETASRLRGRIEAVLSWATVSGHRSGDNPARWKGNLSELLPKPGKVSKAGNFAALSLSDAPTWWAELQRREGMAAQALKFLALTAARSGEVRGAVWQEIDLSARVWTIPAHRMKAGKEHRVPLPEAAIQILGSLPRLEGSAYVFFAARGGMLSDMSISAVMRRMNEARIAQEQGAYLDARSGKAAVPHGLRSTFRDWAAERGYDHVLAELCLAHAVGSEVERAYRRTDMVIRRREMLAEWSLFLQSGGK